MQFGGLTGALIGMGIPEYEAKRYEGRVKDGGILISVHSDNSDWTKRAQTLPRATDRYHALEPADKRSGEQGTFTGLVSDELPLRSILALRLAAKPAARSE